MAVIVFLGTCQTLTMSPAIVLLPRWLGVWLAFVGFVTFLLLGFTLNAVLAVVMPLVLWRGQGWPFWQAALPALPFWIVLSGFLFPFLSAVVPKPW